MMIHSRTRDVLLSVSRAFAALLALHLLVLHCGIACQAQEAAATEEPSEPQVPLMLRTYREIREAPGPDGEMVPIEENKKLRPLVQTMLTSGKFANPDDQKLFDEYFRWRIAEMTWAENLSKLSTMRQRFKKLDLGVSGRAPEPTVHDKLNTTLLNVLQNIAKNDGYHPAVRCNCVLLINLLDQKEEQGAGGVGVVPLPEALPVLVRMSKDPKLRDCVRIPALLGVARHAEFEIPAAARKGDEGVVPLLIEIVGAKQPIGDGTIGGHGWLRRRGAETLGTVAIKWPEANTPQVAGALLSLVGDDEASLVSRSEAAKSVGAIERGALNGNAGTIAQSIGGVAVAVAKRGPVSETAKLGTDYLTYLYLGLLTGLKGTEANRGLTPAAGDAETKEFIRELTKKVEEMLSVTTDPKMQEPTRIERLDTLGDRLAEWLKKAGLKLASGG
jgi:hypothetical protein